MTMQANDDERPDDVRGGQVSDVSGMDQAVDTTGTQETTPPADLAQQRAQGPGRDYREDAVDDGPGEAEVMPHDNT